MSYNEDLYHLNFGLNDWQKIISSCFSVDRKSSEDSSQNVTASRTSLTKSLRTYSNSRSILRNNKLKYESEKRYVSCNINLRNDKLKSQFEKGSISSVSFCCNINFRKGMIRIRATQNCRSFNNLGLKALLLYR